MEDRLAPSLLPLARVASVIATRCSIGIRHGPRGRACCRISVGDLSARTSWPRPVRQPYPDGMTSRRTSAMACPRWTATDCHGHRAPERAAVGRDRCRGVRRRRRLRHVWLDGDRSPASRRCPARARAARPACLRRTLFRDTDRGRIEGSLTWPHRLRFTSGACTRALASKGTSGDAIYEAALATARAMNLSGRVLDFGAGTGTLIARLLADDSDVALTRADLLGRPAAIPRTSAGSRRI